MKIYTRTGDAGETGLFGGARVGKDDIRVEAYGAIDELNSMLGWAAALDCRDTERSLLTELQTDLFVIGAELASLPEKRDALKLHLTDSNDVARLEQHIDALSDSLPVLKNFILPGGTPISAALHQARAVCRRAERRVFALSREHAVSAHILVYLNRLADLLFVLARSAQWARSAPEIEWRAR